MLPTRTSSLGTALPPLPLFLSFQPFGLLFRLAVLRNPTSKPATPHIHVSFVDFFLQLEGLIKLGVALVDVGEVDEDRAVKGKDIIDIDIMNISPQALVL